MAIWLAWPINGQAAKKSKGKKSFVTCQLVMQAHEGESILSYLLSVYALEKTKPPSGGSQAVFSTPVTNKQTLNIRAILTIQKPRDRQFHGNLNGIFRIFIL